MTSTESMDLRFKRGVAAILPNDLSMLVDLLSDDNEHTVELDL